MPISDAVPALAPLPEEAWPPLAPAEPWPPPEPIDTASVTRSVTDPTYSTTREDIALASPTTVYFAMVPTVPIVFRKFGTR